MSRSLFVSGEVSAGGSTLNQPPFRYDQPHFGHAVAPAGIVVLHMMHSVG